MTLSELLARFQGHDIIQRQITQKRYKIELYMYTYLQWRTNRKSYNGLSNGAIFSDLEGLNDTYLRFQGHVILWRRISRKRYEMQT